MTFDGFGKIIVMTAQPQQYLIKDNGIFPGSSFPVLLYKSAFTIPTFFPSRRIKNKLIANGWTNTWRNGIYTRQHYHSNTHEAIAVIKGHTTLLLGGENGIQIGIQKGDVLVLPAGVAHKNLGKMNDVRCVGAYPEGCDYDMKFGDIGERPLADKNIAAIPLPDSGPVAGQQDILVAIWAEVNN